MSEREAGVVSMRFGLPDGQPTLDEIGKDYGVAASGSGSLAGQAAAARDGWAKSARSRA